jgi:hypothetical protein
VEQLSGALMVSFRVRGPGRQDQSPGCDLVAVLLPQSGPGRVERGSLVGQLPCPIQVPGPVRLTGGHRRAAGVGTGAV